MQKTKDLYTQFAATIDLRKYFSKHCRVAGKHMDNRWKYVRDDFCYLLDHWFDVGIFLLDNCIFELRFNNSKDPKNGSDELDLSYWENWKRDAIKRKRVLCAFDTYRRAQR
ncbi:18575_t:CDS:2 [Gigaspora margarita]|uniref:18575_t:CDS:1 n=1 Tax=Gigaspora margarita TaxID=4874 RepID=A0ABN7WL69_GIGMA|nr:18575_t:CDS:2 [Gigaspora margarita]